MELFTVSFFGHRELERALEIEERLERIVTELITEKDYVKFLVGREGEYDLLSSSVIKRVQRKHDYGNSRLILILPYMKAEYRDNENSFHEYYDEIEVCCSSSEVHYKAAIQVRNRIMVDRSDLVVCCVQHNSGGAYKTIQYAMKQGKEVINTQKYFLQK